jgi:hypothetical protein
MLRSGFISRACGTTFMVGIACATAHAANNDITTTISGYGTVAGTVTDDGDTQYISDLQQFRGATRAPDVGQESRLGLQGVIDFGSQFSVTAQALAKRRGDKDFDIGTEWLFGQYTPVPGLDLRLGRVVLPTFLISDSRNVGYAATWLRAPNEVYSLMPFSTLDGGQALWHVNLGPMNVTTQLSYGKTDATMEYAGSGPLSFHAKNVVSGALVADVGDWTVRVADSRMSIPTSVPVAPGNTVSYNNLDKFISAGVQYDNGKAIVMSEWTKRAENDVTGLGKPVFATDSWYVAAGYRFGSFTPMVRYAHIRSNDALTVIPSQGSEGLVLRYDAIRNVAFKVQIDRYDASEADAFTAPQSTTGKKIDVLSIGADFVF